MKKIKINKTTKADTRYCEGIPSKKDLYKDSKTHIKDVKKVLRRLSHKLYWSKHDWTKIAYIDLFYGDFLRTLKNGADFKSEEWYQLHITKEHHHPEDHVADDINLFDIIEYIVDNVCAGKARSGKIREMKLDDSILRKALQNTITIVDNMTEKRNF